ncbi:MAG: hypothetical protein PHP11_01140 [Erysipelotrichaceae bacterium]|nr:hypothetical protein [Erysipelotrichaceae bacterium]MDD4642074.1 hypothetical protein [Erysipelotrichaceae bacterium]
MKKLGLFIGFDLIGEEQLSNIQKKLYDQGFSGKQTKSMPFHILAEIFDEDQKSSLIDKMLKLEHKQSKCSLFVDKIIVENDQLFLHCENNDRLNCLLTDFNINLNDIRILLLEDDHDHILNAHKFLNTLFKPFKLYVDNLHLYVIDPAFLILSIKLT